MQQETCLVRITNRQQHVIQSQLLTVNMRKVYLVMVVLILIGLMGYGHGSLKLRSSKTNLRLNKKDA